MRKTSGVCAPDRAPLLRCLLVCFLVLFGSSGCAEDPLRANSLAGRVFLLQSATGFEPVADATVSLDFTDTLLYVGTGCDSLSFSYELRDGRIYAPSGGAFKIGCDAALEQQDKWVSRFVRAAPRIALRGSELTLTGDEASLLFVDREAVYPDRPFAGTTWLVTGISGEDEDGDFQTSEDHPTMLFHKDGTFEVDTTCNHGTGRYRIQGTQLIVLESSFETRACMGQQGAADKGMRVFLGARGVEKSGPVEFDIAADVLTLREYDLHLGAHAL